ncbi:MAG TPA: GNAT family N-acetyltransferase [Methanoregulaceae archaeon]|nr:GNAT family N-acetyltransferase [Methanoregulaceae archaeon]HNI41465.1 GNAT family N-acetyltransferase [Methanoregulaceae archaeon]HNO08026.1 GNAT family N-acetyltransferase [Methanoregulaceae archaeon]HOU80098.1 GNAT family N-acetyltransferase [Methanoregulaceae archaeon]HPA08840.1 GNAT family N-acetyltransferase [Methanoregulaceae archaeon]
MEENDRIAEFAIGQVTDRTFPEFLHLLEALACYEHLNPPDDTARSRLKSDLLQDHPRYEAYLGRLGDVAVGFVTFFFTYSTFLARPTLYLEDLFVLEQYRGQGLGGRLFDFCRNEARIRGCGRMDWMVLTWNEPSIQFYEKIGAARLGWYTYRLEGDCL